ncbi:MAG: DNRLRE domain-containing protein [Pseudomonadota bacterium]
MTIEPAVTLQINEGLPDGNTTSDDSIEERLSVDRLNEEFGEEGQTQVLIRFDGLTSRLSADTEIVSARIEFFTKSLSPGPVSIGALDAPFTDATTWNSLGGGLSITPESQRSNLSEETLVSFDVTASVRAILAGAPNNGWGLVNADEDGWDFCSELARCDGEVASAADQPRLVVTLAARPVPVDGSFGLIALIAALLLVGTAVLRQR